MGTGASKSLAISQFPVARIAAYTALWGALSRLIIQPILARHLPQYQKMVRVKQVGLLSECCSLVHAVIMTFLAIKKLTGPEELLPGNAPLICIMASFFISDFLLSRPVWTSDPVHLVHHVISVALVTPFTSPTFAARYDRYFPTYFLSELSTIFLDLAKISDLLGYRDTKFNLASALLFALSFFGVRVCYLPYLTYHNLFVHPGSSSRALHFIALVVVLLQYYWFALILRQAKKMASKGSKEKKLV